MWSVCKYTVHSIFYTFFKKGMIKLDYCIKNNKNVFIKLDNNGFPITCVESVKGIFEYSKARNILDNIPKTLKRLNFKLEAIPEIQPKVEEQKVVITNTYIPSENVTR